jgi:tripartite-type tricarboxylate transporter receptor subunit TctC
MSRFSSLSAAFRISSSAATAVTIATLLGGMPDTLRAETLAYPTKAVQIVVGRPAGGPVDIAARVLGQHLSADWKQNTVIENRPGGNGIIGLRAFLQTPADGYTLLVAPDSDFTINRFVLKSWQSSFDNDLVPVARITANPVVLVAGAKSPFNTLQDLIKAAKAQPGTITYATAGAASSPHLVAGYFSERAGIDLRHIPYKGGVDAAAAAAGGHTDLALIVVSSAASLVKSGAVKVLGVSTKERLTSQPDWPTIAEGGLPDFEGDVWTGLFVRTGTSPEIIDKLQAQVAGILKNPIAVQQLEAAGAIPAPLFGAAVKSLIERGIARNRLLIPRLKLAIN